MTAREFYEATVDMRTAQKLYFETWSPKHKLEMMTKEIKVDEEIERVNKLLNKK